MTHSQMTVALSKGLGFMVLSSGDLWVEWVGRQTLVSRILPVASQKNISSPSSSNNLQSGLESCFTSPPCHEYRWCQLWTQHRWGSFMHDGLVLVEQQTVSGLSFQRDVAIKIVSVCTVYQFLNSNSWVLLKWKWPYSDAVKLLKEWSN